MQTLVYDPQKGIYLEERKLPQIQAGEVLLKVQACGICGTDLLKVEKRLPKKPVVLGHELCGTVEAIGPGVSDFKVGDRMVVAHHVPCQECHYCRHGNPSMCRHFKSTNLDPGGFSQYLRVSAEHVQHTAFKVPDSLSSEEALMTEPLSCCVRNVRRAEVKAGDLAILVGMGSIGLMTLQVLKLKGLKVLAIDLKAERRKLALKLGADQSFETSSQEFIAAIQKLSQGRGADLAVFTAGNGALFSQSFQWIRDGGSLNLFASLKDGEATPINLDEIYHREIKIFSSYSPALEDLKEAFELIKDKKINVQSLLTHRLPLKDLEKGLSLMKKQEALKVILEPF